MTGATLLEELTGRGITLWREGDELRCRGPKKTLTPEVLAQLKEHKPEILERLRYPAKDTPSAAWDSEWAGDLMSKALRYLNERYVEEADLSGLGRWHDEIVAAGIAEDQERYRKAVRGYVQAGLRAFEQARKEVA